MISAKELSLVITGYYKDNPTGGNCHIVLDDENVRNCDIEFCRKLCHENNDIEGVVIMNVMSRMRKTSRLKSISLAKKFFKSYIR